MSSLKAALRAVAAAGVLLTALFRPRAASRVARGLLKAIGVRWSVAGAALRPGALLTGNHVSWLDIVVMMAIAPTVMRPPAVGPSGVGQGAAGQRAALADGGVAGRAAADNRPRLRMVAKTEVGAWPVIGRLARASGSIFVDRSRPRMLPVTVAEVADALRKGDTIQVFPEGTTTCGAHPARWRPAFLQAALDAGAPVQRFTLLFSTQKAAFVADETLLASLWRVLRLRGLSVTVLVDEAQRVVATNRKELATRLSPKRASRLQQRVHHGRRA
ncbi:hypothetical protein Rhe02_76070 [Rhizocola hellebori]|uniref:Phospholipid/glycerol acyltransferase domain-containing protein n=1 Tax=Rhizocola hellebori TaxID=1392758 RepID=A0A8J3QET0_9ACTN|nr:hypothetical protein Rhe02_76070 [Rhizocola hellebori]